MSKVLAHKKILLGITGGIAAYKSADLVRKLKKQGAEVRVVMTEAAMRFVTPLTFQALSGWPVAVDPFNEQESHGMHHIDLTRWADIFLVAPASADFIARIAGGLANDLLSALCLASTAKILLAPAMNQQMWENSITQENIKKLQSHGFGMLGPASGSQACGEFGYGRMLEPNEIIQLIISEFQEKSWAGRKILITAGPTREALDPVRYLSNRSSGKMGYALAQAAVDLGAEVTLISGPTALKPPSGVHCISVISAEEMFEQVMSCISRQDVFIAAAAVADYRAREIASHKIKKQAETLQIELIRNPDILAAVAELPNPPYIVGFAAETENVVQNAQEKLKKKKLDLIIANQVSDNQGFDSDYNQVVVISADGSIETLSYSLKSDVARAIYGIVKKIDI